LVLKVKPIQIPAFIRILSLIAIKWYMHPLLWVLLWILRQIGEMLLMSLISNQQSNGCVKCSQEFFEGHTDDITCIALAPGEIIFSGPSCFAHILLYIML
jgi:hypothetical protein